METQKRIFALPGAMTCFVLLVSCAMALAQNGKYACAERNPQSQCHTTNTQDLAATHAVYSNIANRMGLSL
jgi:hypothetical protein